MTETNSDDFQPSCKDSYITKRDKVQMSYKWTIEDFELMPQLNGEALKSEVFPSEKGAPAYWKLAFYPRGHSSSYSDWKQVFNSQRNPVNFSDFVSIGLSLKSSSSSTIFAKCTLRSEDGDGNAIDTFRSEFMKTFRAPNPYGIRYSLKRNPVQIHKQPENRDRKEFGPFIKRATLISALQSSRRNSITIYCDITVFLRVSNVRPQSSQPSLKAFSDAYSSNDLECLLTDGLYSDFLITVQKRKFKVHKSILHARSSVFAAMFTTNMKESKTNQVTIDDVDPDVFEKLLKFIYTGHLVCPETDAVYLLPLADKYDIGVLRQQCTDVLNTRLSVANAVKTLILADIHCLADLKEKTVDFICANKEMVSVTGDWPELVKGYPKLVGELFSKALKAEETGK